MRNKIEKDKVQLQTCLEPWAPTTNGKMTIILVMCNAHDSLNSTNRVMCNAHDETHVIFLLVVGAKPFPIENN